jgi:hypothetical protein
VEKGAIISKSCQVEMLGYKFWPEENPDKLSGTHSPLGRLQ